MNPDAIRERFTLRNAERTSLLASATAVCLTIVMVGGGQASETNPASAWLIGKIGIHAWALLTPLFIVGLFGLFRITARKESGLTRASAWFVATALFADATGNVIGTLAVGGSTAPVPWLSVSSFLALALVLSFRSELSTLAGYLSAPSLSTVRTVGFAALIVGSTMFAPVSFTGDISPIGTTEAATPGEVMFTGHDSRVKAMDPTDGTVLWTFDTGNSAVIQDIQRFQDYVYVSRDDGVVNKLKVSDGSTVWSADIGGASSAVGVAPGPNGKYVFVGTNSGNVIRASASDGTTDWTTSVEGSSSYVNDISASPSGNYVYAAGTSGAYQLNSSDGAQNWFFSSSSKLNTIVAGPNGNNVYTGGLNDILRSHSVSDGTQGWSDTLGADVIEIGVSPGGNNIYSIDDFSSLYRHDNTGTQITKTGQIGTYGFSIAVGANGDNVYTGETDNTRAHPSTNLGSTTWAYSDTTNKHVVGSGTQANGVYDVASTNPVSGTVADSDGNSVGGATVETGTGKTTTTASDGSYSLSLVDGTYDITASKSGYVSETNSVTVSGSAITGNDYSLGGNLGGRMVNQNGEPVANGTVEVWGVNYSEINPDASQTLEERARELIENSSDPLPDEWEPTRQLAGSSGAWSNADGKYVAVYEDTDIGTAPWVDSADLSPNLQVPAGEPVKFVVADPTAGSGYLDNEYDRQIPGRVVGGDSVKIEQLSPDGSATDVTTVEIDQSAGGGLLDPSSLEYGSTNLPPGIYRASVEDSPFELVFTVGSPQDLAAAFQKDLKSDAGDLTQRAKDIRNRVSSNKFKRVTATTGPDGYWSAPVTGKNVDRVAVQGYKGPYNLMGTSPENATLADLNAVYDSTTGYNGSIASPSGVSQTDLPNHNLTVRTVETTGPRHPNLRAYDNLTMSFLGLLENETFANMVRSNLNMSDSDVSKVNSQLTELRQSNEELQARYDELRAQREETTGTAPTNETENRLLRQAIQELRGELQPEEPDTSYNNGTVSATIPWNGELDADTVAVVAHHPGSGTSEPVPDEYVSVNKRMGQGDTVEVNDYPVPEGSPMVSFSVTVNGEDGESIGDTTIPARNPNFNGRMMDLDSMSISTLKPGPSEQVRIGFNPSDTSAQIKSVDASVEGPNGPLTVTNGDTNKTVKFTTDGQGDYYGTVDITDKSGNTWTEGFTLRAGPRETNRPPSIRVRDGATGQFAVVGDGLTDGSVNTNNGIASLTAVAKEAPGNVHFYTSQISNNYGKTEVNIMKDGPTGAETANKHVQIYLHTGDLKDNAVIYRNDNEPLAVGESTGFGSVTCDGESDGCTIKSYTDAGGAATFTINNNPTFVSRTLHWARLNIPVDLPGLFVFPVPDGIPMGMGPDAFHFQSVGVGIDTADIATLPSPDAVTGGVPA